MKAWCRNKKELHQRKKEKMALFSLLIFKFSGKILVHFTAMDIPSFSQKLGPEFSPLLFRNGFHFGNGIVGFDPGSFLELLKRQPFFLEGFARGFKVGDLFFNSSEFLLQPFLADSCKRNKSVLAHGDLSLVYSNIEKIINRSQVTENKI